MMIGVLEGLEGFGGLTGFRGGPGVWAASGEGNFVVPPAASLRGYHPREQRPLAWDPVLRQSGRVAMGA